MSLQYDDKFGLTEVEAKKDLVIQMVEKEYRLYLEEDDWVDVRYDMNSIYNHVLVNEPMARWQPIECMIDRYKRLVKCLEMLKKELR